MRLLFLSLLLVSAACLAGVAERLNVNFTNAENQRFNTSTLSEDISRAYPTLGETFKDASVLLVETPNLQDNQYEQQEAILDKIGAGVGDLRLIVVLACSASEDHDRYYVSRLEAQALMGPDGKFRVLLLDSTGHVLSRQSKPFTEQDLHKILKR